MTLIYTRKFLSAVSLALSCTLVTIGGSACGTAPQNAENAAAAPAGAQAPNSGSTFARSNPVGAVGSYGGPGIYVAPQSGSQAVIGFNCANGTIAIDLSTVHDGSSFNADGTWVSRSGPITTAGHPTLAAHYSGSLNASHLRLNVTIAQANGTTAAQSYDAYAGEAMSNSQACPL
jgi:hypothetical protein